LDIATNIATNLGKHCHHLHIAGSIRREMPYVGDIEIVCSPHLEFDKNLFGEVTNSAPIQPFTDAVNNLGAYIKNGSRYKQIALTHHMNLDIFIPLPHDYYRQLVLRTGSAKYAKNVIAHRWLMLGWCGTPQGLRRIRDCESKLVAEKRIWTCVVQNP